MHFNGTGICKTLSTRDFWGDANIVKNEGCGHQPALKDPDRRAQVRKCGSIDGWMGVKITLFADFGPCGKMSILSREKQTLMVDQKGLPIVFKHRRHISYATGDFCL
jgi:hypothetical protein